MTPKNNDDASKELNTDLKLLQTEKAINKTLTLQNIDCNGKQTDVQPTTTTYNSNNNNNLLILKPIINNTSIKKASNKKCNLIGKMINDVSKTTISGFSHHSKQNDKTIIGTITTKTPTTSTPTIIPPTTLCSSFSSSLSSSSSTKFSTTSEGGKNNNNKSTDDDNDDFHNTTTTNMYLVNEQLKTITNDEQQKQQKIRTMSLNEVKPESTSSSRSIIVNSSNIVLNKHQQRRQQQPYDEESKIKGEHIVTVIPSLLHNFNKRLRHKNKTIIPLNDSYQRTADLETLKTRDKQIRNQCELLELNCSQEKDLLILENQQNAKDYINQTLAERKALLKKEFFKDLSNTQGELTTKPSVKLKTHTTASSTLNKRVLKNQHNLKLKIPKSSIKDTKNLNVSLVALRKLDLQKKLHKNLAAKEAQPQLINNSQFPRVKDLAKKFDYHCKMIVPQTTGANSKSELKTLKSDSVELRHSPLSDEGCNLGQSPYSSDDDNDSIRTTHTAIERIPGQKRKDKVARSASSDSALGLEVDEPMDITEQQQLQQQKRRMTLTVTDLPLRPALLPLAEPTLLPDSPTLDVPIILSSSLQQTQVPTKVLLEERVVEIPEDPRSGGSSRRESSNSCFSDYPATDMQGVRFVRTPSVVVSDYSDDITCGITLEEIEYFRAQRLRRRRSSLDTAGNEKDAIDNNSDISASSSCSNLYYCGSTISALDGAECLVNGVRLQLERKTSDCSNYSISGDEDCSPQPNFTIPEQPEDCQDITDMLANQHISNKRSKKVGISGALLTVDNPNFV